MVYRQLIRSSPLQSSLFPPLDRDFSFSHLLAKKKQCHMVVEYYHNNLLLQKLRQSWEEIEKNKTSTGVSAEQMYVFNILCVYMYIHV